ncbi:MAG: PASTA domain-containing protein [Bacteroidaceae bacterium]|nr:PASTA domain-containing protein [Bacteroidaceae bacterium]
MDIKQYFTGHKAKVIVINLACIIAVLILAPIATMFYLDNYTHHGERIEVPSVDGMTVEEAESTLSKYGLIAVITDSVKKKGYLPGTICMQTPRAGSGVKDGRMIYLTVIRTSETLVNFPDVAGNMSVDEARQMLKNLGFTFTPDKEIESEDKGMVLSVYQGNKKVYANQSLSTKYPLTLYVGKGIAEDTIYNDVDLYDDTFEEESL